MEEIWKKWFTLPMDGFPSSCPDLQGELLPLCHFLYHLFYRYHPPLHLFKWWGGAGISVLFSAAVSIREFSFFKMNFLFSRPYIAWTSVHLGLICWYSLPYSSILTTDLLSFYFIMSREFPKRSQSGATWNVLSPDLCKAYWCLSFKSSL